MKGKRAASAAAGSTTAAEVWRKKKKPCFKCSYFVKPHKNMCFFWNTSVACVGWRVVVVEILTKTKTNSLSDAQRAQNSEAGSPTVFVIRLIGEGKLNRTELVPYTAIAHYEWVTFG